jgi:hypothetical protein
MAAHSSRSAIVRAIFRMRKWETGFTKPQIKDVPALIFFLGYDPEPPSPVTIADHLRDTEEAWLEPKTDRFVPLYRSVHAI